MQSTTYPPVLSRADIDAMFNESMCDESELLSEAMYAELNPDQVSVASRIAIGPVARIRVCGPASAIYAVPSDHPKSSKVYRVETVDHRVNSCTCADWRRRSIHHQHVCKHMRAVEMFLCGRLADTRARIEHELESALDDHNILQVFSERYEVAAFNCPLFEAIHKRIENRRHSLANGMRFLADPVTK